MNQTEIDELRRLASVSREPRHGIGCIASDCALASAARNAIPRLLAALDEAEAEQVRMRDVLLRKNFAPCDTQACNCGGWHERATGGGFYARFREIEEAIGDHNGKTLLAAVVEMVQERDSLEEARAERDRARQKIQAMEEQAMADEDGMSMRPLDGRLRKVEAERDALKATLAKHAESERAWCELATERGAKLAALANASTALIEGIDEFSSDCTTRYETCLEDLDNLREALAAAKVQP